MVTPTSLKTFYVLNRLFAQVLHSFIRMQGSGELENQKLKPKGWMKAICCSCWPSVSSCGEGGNLDRTTTIASAEHMMVQDKLDQRSHHMILEKILGNLYWR
ncbi:hypothetical protein ACET3Z_004483 [Daucus carota]